MGDALALQCRSSSVSDLFGLALGADGGASSEYSLAGANPYCAPIWFETYGREVLTDVTYIETCYQQVVEAMQGELDKLVTACC